MKTFHPQHLSCSNTNALSPQKGEMMLSRQVRVQGRKQGWERLRNKLPIGPGKLKGRGSRWYTLFGLETEREREGILGRTRLWLLPNVRSSGILGRSILPQGRTPTHHYAASWLVRMEGSGFPHTHGSRG